MKTLTPYEQWAVRANLLTCRETGISIADQATIVEANGYQTIADGIRHAGTHCATCDTEFAPAGCTPGYGTDAAGLRYCYECCGKRELADMRATGRATLYLSEGTNGRMDDNILTDWPGTLRFVVRNKRTSRNNWGSRRVDVWFVLDGHYWHGVHVGERHQLCRCRRTKATTKQQ